MSPPIPPAACQYPQFFPCPYVIQQYIIPPPAVQPVLSRPVAREKARRPRNRIATGPELSVGVDVSVVPAKDSDKKKARQEPEKCDELIQTSCSAGLGERKSEEKQEPEIAAATVTAAIRREDLPIRGKAEYDLSQYSPRSIQGGDKIDKKTLKPYLKRRSKRMEPLKVTWGKVPKKIDCWGLRLAADVNSKQPKMKVVGIHRGHS